MKPTYRSRPPRVADDVKRLLSKNPQDAFSYMKADVVDEIKREVVEPVQTTIALEPQQTI
jgi:hypothetical protein